MIQFRKEQVGEVIERLYDSEINAEINWFWDTGFSVAIGDSINGRVVFSPITPEHIKINSHSIADAISVLAWQARQIYPDSEFSKWYNELESFIEIERAAKHGELVFYPENASVSIGVLSFEVDA